MNEAKLAGCLNGGPLIHAYESATYADFLLLTPLGYHEYDVVACHAKVPPERVNDIRRGNYLSLQGRVVFRERGRFSVGDSKITGMVLADSSSIKCNYELIADFFQQRKYREAYRFIRNLQGIICHMNDNEISECHTVFSKHLGKREARIFKEMALKKFPGIEMSNAFFRELLEISAEPPLRLSMLEFR